MSAPSTRLWMPMLRRHPITQEEAFRYVNDVHRHHDKPAGWICGLGVARLGDAGWVVCGVAIVGRPVNKTLDSDPFKAEILRCCTDGTPNVPTMLYRAAIRAARALGYQDVFTYTLAHETGTSLQACGFTPKYLTKGGSWSCPSRPRVDTAPIGQNAYGRQRER